METGAVTDESIKRIFDLANKDFLNERIHKVNSVLDEYGINNFYISYSGGKDSSVVDKLIDIAVPGNQSYSKGFYAYGP